MLNERMRDLLGGLLLLVLGLFVAWYAMANYNTGTFRRMGPGMFPVGAGLVLATLGLLIAAPAVLVKGPALDDAPDRPRVQVLSVVCVLASVICFALALSRFGLFPAIALLVTVASMAGTDRRPLRLIILIPALCAVAWLVFRFSLNLPLTLFRWP
jgi:hypothetical protein